MGTSLRVQQRFQLRQRVTDSPKTSILTSSWFKKAHDPKVVLRVLDVSRFQVNGDRHPGIGKIKIFSQEYSPQGGEGLDYKNSTSNGRGASSH